MRSGREELGNAGCLEASLRKTEGGTKTGATSTNDDGVILVINNCVIANSALTLASKHKSFIYGSDGFSDETWHTAGNAGQLWPQVSPKHEISGTDGLVGLCKDELTYLERIVDLLGRANRRVEGALSDSSTEAVSPRGKSVGP